MVAVIKRFFLVFRSEWLVIPVVLVAGVLRIYKISAQPLWLDEIYAVQLSRQGLTAILQNSLRDPHPPLYYILQMITSGLWNVQSEWGWRWLSALCGIITVPAFYFLCRRFSGRVPATVATLTLAVSPFHIYYSQEARPYTFVTLLAVLSTIIVADLLENSNSRNRWIALTIISIIGLFSDYFYILIIGVQAFILLIHTRQREWLVYAVINTACIALAIISSFTTLSISAFHNINAKSLTIISLLQSLAGETARFGTKWQNWLVMSAVIVIILLGLVKAIDNIKRLLVTYIAMQLLLPVLFFLALNLFVKIKLPFYETRQFLILTPALFCLFAVGLDFAGRYSKPIIPLLFCIPILLASIAGITAYWNMTKSPEGSLVLRVRPKILSTDIVVSLDYSSTAASYFYLPGDRVVTFLRESKGESEFTNNLLLYPLNLSSPTPTTETSTTIRRANRFWVLNRNPVDSDRYLSLTERCTPLETTVVTPFTASLWDNCQP